MNTLSLILSSLSLIGLAVASVLFRSYLFEYIREKGKNAASKEDLAHLTRIVEGVKAAHSSEIERLKAELVSEGQVIERRRKVYEQMCSSLRIFISGHEASGEAKKQFHASYADAWLWAPDEILTRLNAFLALQQKATINPSAVSQVDRKKAYSDVVIAMRRDVGFKTTSVTTEDYQFVTFS